MLDYRIVEKAPFTVVGVKHRFNSDTSYQEIPKFWNEWTADMKGLKGMFGVCLDIDGKDFDYWIADKIMYRGRISRKAVSGQLSPVACGLSSNARGLSRTVCRA